MSIYLHFVYAQYDSPPKKARRTKVNVEIKKKGSGGGKAKKGGRE